MRMPDGLEVQITGMRAKVARENERERERESLLMAISDGMRAKASELSTRSPPVVVRIEGRVVS